MKIILLILFIKFFHILLIYVNKNVIIFLYYLYNIGILNLI